MPFGLSTWFVAFAGVLVAVFLAVFGYVYYAMGLQTSLEDAGRRLGVTRWVAAPALVVALAGFGSAFVLGDVPSEDLPFVAAGVVFAGGVFGLTVAAGNVDEYRLVRRTSTADAVAVDSGRVEVSGTAVPAGDAAKTPFTGTEAVCYDWRVLEYRWTGRHSNWVAVRVGKGGTPFYVDDGTGRVLVDPAGGDLRPTEDGRVEVEAGDRPSERVAAFLTDRGMAAESDHDRRYEERFLPAGADATVLGTARGEYAGEYPDDVVVGSDEPPLVVAGTAAEAEARLRRPVVWGGVGGLVAAVAGYAGRLLAVGAL